MSVEEGVSLPEKVVRRLATKAAMKPSSLISIVLIVGVSAHLVAKAIAQHEHPAGAKEKLGPLSSQSPVRHRFSLVSTARCTDAPLFLV